MQASTLAGPSRAGGGRGAPAGIAGKGTVATVFGLDVRCDSPLALLHGAHAPPTGRALELQRTSLARL